MNKVSKADWGKIRREDFSIQGIQLEDGTVLYQAFAHFAPYIFNDVQRGRHKYYQVSNKNKEEVLNLLIKVIIKDLEELIKVE